MQPEPPEASIIIPALAANETLQNTIKSILDNPGSRSAEIIVVNDGLDEKINLLEKTYPIKVVDGNKSGIAAARNIGVNHSRGRIVIFTDSDCRASSNWLAAHLNIHKQTDGMIAVGGSVCIESQASFWALCDHYCSWYNVHPYQNGRWVPNQPGANLSMTRNTFERVGPFKKDLPSPGVHEDIEWQKRLIALGGRIYFHPLAVIWHTDRSDLKGYLAHHFRWGYNSIEVKSRSKVTRFPWIYTYPSILILGYLPFSVAHTIYVITKWLIAGKVLPIFLGPFIYISRLSYAIGMAVGGIRYLNARTGPDR